MSNCYLSNTNIERRRPNMNKNRKQQSEMNTHDKTKQQRQEGYTGDKKLGGPNRPAE